MSTEEPPIREYHPRPPTPEEALQKSADRTAKNLGRIADHLEFFRGFLTYGIPLGIILYAYTPLINEGLRTAYNFVFQIHDPFDPYNHFSDELVNVPPCTNITDVEGFSHCVNNYYHSEFLPGQCFIAVNGNTYCSQVPEDPVCPEDAEDDVTVIY